MKAPTQIRAWEVEGVPSTEWNGAREWGLSSRHFGNLNAANGVQLTYPVNLGEFAGLGSPKLYELRFTTVWSDVLAGPFFEGLLQAEVTYGVGTANHSVLLDIYNDTSIVVPAGTISVAVSQVGQWGRQLNGVSVSIAAYAGGKLAEATCSVIAPQVAAPGPPPTVTMTGAVPRRGKAVRVAGRYDLGLYQLFLSTAAGGNLAMYDSGTDRALMISGIPIPATCAYWTVVRTPGATQCLPSFILD